MTATCALGALVHQVFDGLLSSALWLHLVHRRVNHLAVDSLELAVGAKVDFNVVMLVEQLANQLEEAEQGLVVDGLLHVYVLRHHSKVWFDERSHLNLGLGFEFSHLRVVVQTVNVQEVVVQAYVGHLLVVH